MHFLRSGWRRHRIGLPNNNQSGGCDILKTGTAIRPSDNGVKLGFIGLYPPSAMASSAIASSVCGGTLSR